MRVTSIKKIYRTQIAFMDEHFVILNALGFFFSTSAQRLCSRASKKHVYVNANPGERENKKIHRK